MIVKVNNKMTKMVLVEEMVPVNCRDEELSQVDGWEGGKDDKEHKVRTITKTTKCRLQDNAIQEDEETQSDEEYLEKQRERDEEKRKERMLNPLKDVEDDFSSLGRGIVEDGEEAKVLEDTKKKKKKNAVRGNPWRDKDTGQMTDKEGAGSFSLYFAGKGKKGKKGRAQVKGGKEMFTKADDCGRADVNNTSKNTFKCSEPKKKYKE